jgi:Recombinase
VLRGESLRSIAMDWNERGIKTVGGVTWQGSMIRRVLMSPRIAGLKEHRGEIVGEATWPGMKARDEGGIDGSYRFLTAEPISKSDRPYAHSLGAVAASARHGLRQRALDDDHHLHT